MDTAHRAALVRAYRLELKQAWSRRPTLSERPSDSERRGHRQRLADWENSREGMRVGERLRQRLEGERPQYILARGLGRREYHVRREAAANASPAKPLSFRDILRANRRMRSRTQFSGPNGVLVTLTPHERVNRIGVASRRRRVSAGLVPGGDRTRRLGRHEP